MNFIQILRKRSVSEKKQFDLAEICLSTNEHIQRIKITLNIPVRSDDD